MSSSINHDPGALWDWDSVLLLAHPLVDSAAAAEESGAQGEDEELQQQLRRRRDPKLSCPNYLAGRVPCACSDEEDDDEGDRSHKRSKLAPRCQVPTCKSDLFGLKGYHQRHRVCLNCANSTSVFVRNQHQRYCQQCGKFHPLADFDNGKRSCRRKLEKHNYRRRRKLSESPAADAFASGEPSTLSSDKDAPSSNNTNNSEGSDAGGVTHRLAETPESGALYSLESHEQRFRGKEQAEVLPHEHEAFALDTSASGDETLLALLLDEQEGQQHNKQQLQSTTRQQEKNDKHLCPSISSSGVRRRAGYTPPCPTRRISFKFYDWNPADFPRRLRGQILEWLANMPVELEGYIRSGCTILTLYIAMPETGWTKLHEDWNGQLMRLIAGAEAGFWDKGFVAAFLDSQVAYIDHGLVSSPSMCDKAIRKYPVIQTVSPICLEAGKRASVMVAGHNLLELNARLLVGSEGKYLACYVSSRGMNSLQVDIVSPGRYGVGFIEVAYDYGMSNFVPVLIADRELCREVQTLELEMQLPSVCCSSSGSDGVEKQQEVFNLLLDLGWVARRLQDTTSRLTIPAATDSDLARLQQLLIFVTERKWCTAAQQVLQVSRSLHLLERVGIQRALQLAVLRNNADITELLLRFADYSTKKSTTISFDDSPWSRYAESIQYASRPRRQQHFQLRCKKKYIFKAALGVAVACAGLCIVLQHPQRVLDLSTSLRRCLWYKQQP